MKRGGGGRARKPALTDNLTAITKQYYNLAGRGRPREPEGGGGGSRSPCARWRGRAVPRQSPGRGGGWDSQSRVARMEGGRPWEEERAVSRTAGAWPERSGGASMSRPPWGAWRSAAAVTDYTTTTLMFRRSEYLNLYSQLKHYMGFQAQMKGVLQIWFENKYRNYKIQENCESLILD